MVGPCHEVARVEETPARAAHVGAGNHDSGGQGGATHGTHRVLVHVRVKGLVLPTVQQSQVNRRRVIADDRRHTETEEVGGSPGVGVV